VRSSHSSGFAQPTARIVTILARTKSESAIGRAVMLTAERAGFSRQAAETACEKHPAGAEREKEKSRILL